MSLASPAETDLEQIAEWYAERHASGLDRFVRTFAEVRDLLATFPRAGRERDEIRPSVRSYIAHPFLAFYRNDESARTVSILRILHGHMDIHPYDLEPRS